MNLIKNLKWRYYTKKINVDTSTDDKVDAILDAIQLAPTSSGILPFNVFIISDKKILAEIQSIAVGQIQITDCSYLLIFANWEKYTLEKIEKAFNYTLSERGLPLNTMDDYKNGLWELYSNLPEYWLAKQAAKQACLALDVAFVAAAEQKIDATIVEGFDSNALDELLNLKEKGLKTASLLTLGYRDTESDWLLYRNKVRKPKNELFIKL